MNTNFMELSELSETLYQHSLWLSSYKYLGKRANFENRNLTGRKFSYHNLKYAKFDNAVLRCTSFDYCDLEDASFKNSDLRGAYFDYTTNISLVDFPLTDRFFYSPYGLWHIQREYIRLGRLSYSSIEWQAFVDENINKIRPQALEWWIKNKEIILFISSQCDEYKD